MEEFLKEFRQTIDTASVDLLRISEEQSTIPLGEGKWSPKQIIGHLIDSAANNHQRFIRGQFSDDLVFLGYDQEKWVNVQSYNELPWVDLLEFWRRYNLHLLHVVSHIPENILTVPRKRHNSPQIGWQTVPEGEPTTLDYLVRDYLKHLKHHLQQVGLVMFKDEAVS